MDLFFPKKLLSERGFLLEIQDVDLSGDVGVVGR